MRVAHVGAAVTVRLHRERVRIYTDAVLVADHARARDGARLRLVEPKHFASLFGRKPKAQVMLYRDVVIGLGGCAPTFLGELSRRHRDRLREELLCVYALYEEHGAEQLLAAMALAESAGSYSAASLALLLQPPSQHLPHPQPLPLPGIPTQAQVDRLLESYELWVQVDVALPEVTR